MATTQSQLQNRFALVSSLYGPGTIICWYLTTLSVLVSWTLHPRKRKSGSIDVDLIAVLTLPAVAAGHLASQVRGFLNQDNDAQTSSNADWKYLQSIAAIEAPFNVTETFMAISVILFIVAAWMFCIRRAICVALVGLQCFTVDCYIHFSEFRDLGLRYVPGVSARNYPAFSRLFVADFAGLVIAILVTLSACGLISAAIALFMLAPSRTPSSRSRRDIERVNEAAPRERMPFRFGTPAVEVTRSTETTHGTRLFGRSEGLYLRAITVVTTLFLPVTFILSLLPPFWHSTTPSNRAFRSATTPFWQTLDRDATRFVRDFFPRTACSITDLDQVVAAAAGATVLGFSVYSVAKAYYKKWNVRRTPPSEPTGAELSRVENHPAS
jgi:hypothetical protein